MKKLFFGLLLLNIALINSQNSKNFKQPNLIFEGCESATDKEACFDQAIISRILEVSHQDVTQYLNKYPNCKHLTLHVSFIIDEKGKPIPESIKNTKNKISKIEEKLDNLVLKLPKIKPLKNEYNYPLLKYYSLYIDVSVNEKNQLIVLDKRKEASNSDSNFASPIYPGCKEKSNKELKQCFSNNVSKIINKKFNTNKALKNFNKKGTINSYILFNIDKEGEATKIISFAPNKRISDEAKRALGKIKRLKPGTMDNKTVIVPYMIPLVFRL